MSYAVSTATVDDLDQVAQLIDDYVRQNLNLPAWPCAIAQHLRDGLSLRKGLQNLTSLFLTHEMHY
jgi:hypothetical protein